MASPFDRAATSRVSLGRGEGPGQAELDRRRPGIPAPGHRAADQRPAGVEAAGAQVVADACPSSAPARDRGRRARPAARRPRAWRRRGRSARLRAALGELLGDQGLERGRPAAGRRSPRARVRARPRAAGSASGRVRSVSASVPLPERLSARPGRVSAVAAKRKSALRRPPSGPPASIGSAAPSRLPAPETEAPPPSRAIVTDPASRPPASLAVRSRRVMVASASPRAVVASVATRPRPRSRLATRRSRERGGMGGRRPELPFAPPRDHQGGRQLRERQTVEGEAAVQGAARRRVQRAAEHRARDPAGNERRRPRPAAG